MKRITAIVITFVFSLILTGFGNEGKAQSIDELKNTIRQLEAKNSALESKVKVLQKGKNKSAAEAEETIQQLQKEKDSLWRVIEGIRETEKRLIEAEANVKLVKISIKDPIFYEYLLRYCDMDNDGSLTQWDAEHTYVIDIARDKSVLNFIGNSSQITSIEGIESFVNLKRLVCSGNVIPQMDLSKNVQLETFIANSCELKLLDVSKNEKLAHLECSNNLLYTIDLKGNPNLQYLDVSKNKMASVDLSGCANLRFLNCSSNTLTNLDVSNNLELQMLDCSNNKLSMLSFVTNTSLNNIICSNNKLRDVDVRNGIDIEYFDCSKNKDLEFVYFSKGCRILSDKRDPKTYFK